jgi:hypothetical protein
MPDYPKLRGDREAPMRLANNVLSREVPTFRHDRKDSEYTQVSPYRRSALIGRFVNCIAVSWMMAQGEISIKILHSDFDGVRNSCSVDTLLGYPFIIYQLNDQCYEISPEYAKGIFEMLENPKTNMKEISSLAGHMDSGPEVMKDGK